MYRLQSIKYRRSIPPPLNPSLAGSGIVLDPLGSDAEKKGGDIFEYSLRTSYSGDSRVPFYRGLRLVK